MCPVADCGFPSSAPGPLPQQAVLVGLEVGSLRGLQFLRKWFPASYNVLPFIPMSGIDV